MVLPRIKSLYGFLVVERRSAESSSGSGDISEPNQVRFRSRTTWKKAASSSLYCPRASSKRFMPSREIARLSYVQFEIIATKMYGEPEYLQHEERTKVPPGHLHLSLGTLHLRFSLREGRVKGSQDSLLQLCDKVRPCCWILEVGRPYKLYASEVGLGDATARLARRTDLSFLSVLKSARILSSTEVFIWNMRCWDARPSGRTICTMSHSWCLR